MGGGNHPAGSNLGHGVGLSPRGRGKPSEDGYHRYGLRSIPAWAGETARRLARRWILRVYPRVGGGNLALVSSRLSRKGLSPRGRGKRFPRSLRPGYRGSIPAWAGETARGTSAGNSGSVYPRVGGGNSTGAALARAQTGLSPRGRGKHYTPPAGTANPGSIPAWAGETIGKTGGTLTTQVYPRVGGGNVTQNRKRADYQGLSPRGRGKPLRLDSCHRQRRVYPRVGGGNPPRLLRTPPSCGLSPRGRGKPRRSVPAVSPPGSIPAWAGETAVRHSRAEAIRVYPRVGGGNPGMPAQISLLGGLSPRGRGKPPL